MACGLVETIQLKRASTCRRRAIKEKQGFRKNGYFLGALQRPQRVKFTQAKARIGIGKGVHCCKDVTETTRGLLHNP